MEIEESLKGNDIRKAWSTKKEERGDDSYIKRSSKLALTSKRARSSADDDREHVGREELCPSSRGPNAMGLV